jgi:hypothetical protein
MRVRFIRIYDVEGNRATIRFDHAENGLTSFNKPLQYFEIAGKDKMFYPAQAVYRAVQLWYLHHQLKSLWLYVTPLRILLWAICLALTGCPHLHSEPTIGNYEKTFVALLPVMRQTRFCAKTKSLKNTMLPGPAKAKTQAIHALRRWRYRLKCMG